MGTYKLRLRGDPDEAEWVLTRNGANLSLTDPNGQVVFEAVPAHQTVNLNELYGEGKISFTIPHAILPFRKQKVALTALRTAVEIGLAGDTEFRNELRREALRLVRRGFTVFVVAGGLFTFYCWLVFTYGDPPPGSWLMWVLKWFGWLISGVLIVLLGFALAGPVISWQGLRQWLRLWRISLSADAILRAGQETTSSSNSLLPEQTEPVSRVRLECPKCASARVKKLPPSQITPHPGYICGNCGLRMRAPRMLFLYLVGLVLGSCFVALFLALLFDLDRTGQRAPAPAFMFGVMGLVCVVYSLKQIARPVPTRVPVASNTDKHTRETWG